MNNELIIALVEEKIEKLLDEVDKLMEVKKDLFNSVSNTPSQDLSLDPRNEEDYDTWEYGTEPLPGDEEWANKFIN